MKFYSTGLESLKRVFQGQIAPLYGGKGNHRKIERLKSCLESEYHKHSEGS
jgi:hypothetical protein